MVSYCFLFRPYAPSSCEVWYGSCLKLGSTLVNQQRWPCNHLITQWDMIWYHFFISQLYIFIFLCPWGICIYYSLKSLPTLVFCCISQKIILPSRNNFMPQKPIRSYAHMKKTYHTPGTVFSQVLPCKLDWHATFCQQKLLPANKKTHRIYIRSKLVKIKKTNSRGNFCLVNPSSFMGP